MAVPERMVAPVPSVTRATILPEAPHCPEEAVAPVVQAAAAVVLAPVAVAVPEAAAKLVVRLAAGSLAQVAVAVATAPVVELAAPVVQEVPVVAHLKLQPRVKFLLTQAPHLQLAVMGPQALKAVVPWAVFRKAVPAEVTVVAAAAVALAAMAA